MSIGLLFEPFHHSDAHGLSVVKRAMVISYVSVAIEEPELRTS